MPVKIIETMRRVLSSCSHSCMPQAASFRLVPQEARGSTARTGGTGRLSPWATRSRADVAGGGSTGHAGSPALTATPAHLYLHTWTPARLVRGTATSDLAPCRAPRRRGVQHHIGPGIRVLLTCILSLDRFGTAWCSLLLHPSPSGAALRRAASVCRRTACSAQLPAEVGGPRLPQVAWEREEKLNASNPLSTEAATSL